MAKTHDVVAIVEGQAVRGWQSYNIETSIITAADTFLMRIPYTADIWRTVRRDARITIKADGVTMIDGFVDKRMVRAKSGVLEVSGRDRVGRLTDESAPNINYNGMTILAAVRKLAAPWFTQVTLDDSRNRTLRRGKGKRVAAGTEPTVQISVRVPRQGVVHPGETRWHLIHEIVSRAGLVAYSTADGKELFVGKVNQAQEPQYMFVHAAPGSKTQGTVRDMTVSEDDGDRFSMIMVAGVGGQTDTNYGQGIVDNRGVTFDNFANRVDGTGRDFIHPKRMFMPERAFGSYRDAQRVADNERARRDFNRHKISVEAHTWGQVIDGDQVTFFAPNTVARVINEEMGIDDTYFIVSCSFSGSRDTGDMTTLHMVPTGTEIVL